NAGTTGARSANRSRCPCTEQRSASGAAAMPSAVDRSAFTADRRRYEDVFLPGVGSGASARVSDPRGEHIPWYRVEQPVAERVCIDEGVAASAAERGAGGRDFVSHQRPRDVRIWTHSVRDRTAVAQAADR